MAMPNSSGKGKESSLDRNIPSVSIFLYDSKCKGLLRKLKDCAFSIAYLPGLKVFIGLTVLLCSAFSGLQGNDSYSEYWQKFFWTMWKRDPLSFGTYVKIETGNHLRGIRSIQLSEQLAYQVSDNFSCEFHYTYINGHSIVPDSPRIWQQRLEFEGNRTFHLGCRNLITTRNRLEVRKLQNNLKIRCRLRQLSMLVIPMEGHGRLKSFSMYNELFYDLSTYEVNQDRVCPFMFTFALSKKVDLDVFFLVRFFLSNDIWQKSAVFGTQFSF